MRGPDYRGFFTSPEVEVPEKCPADEWSTQARVRLLDANPSFKALGLGSGFTGLGVDTLIIDDPYKNREEALSEAVNKNIRGWWTDVVLPRLNPDTNVVVMFHRWTENDFAGFLMASGEWEQYRFPAIGDGAKEPAPDALGREPGIPLTDRYSVEYLEAIKAEQGLSFYALYQGTPYPPEGSLFKVENLKIEPASPAECNRVRYWDKAATVAGGDFTAGVRIARDANGCFWIEDVCRGQWDTDSRDKKIRQVAELDGTKVRIGGEQEPGAAGKDAALAFIRLLAGFYVSCAPASGSKEVRADPLSAQVNAGNVRLVKGDWNKAFIEEMQVFPQGKHDDQVDAASGAFNLLTTQTRFLIA
jgi:predicted phage terminase large subunit-like protein